MRCRGFSGKLKSFIDGSVRHGNGSFTGTHRLASGHGEDRSKWRFFLKRNPSTYEKPSPPLINHPSPLKAEVSYAGLEGMVKNYKKTREVCFS